jgi:hypothetical protein
VSSKFNNKVRSIALAVMLALVASGLVACAGTYRAGDAEWNACLIDTKGRQKTSEEKQKEWNCQQAIRRKRDAAGGGFDSLPNGTSAELARQVRDTRRITYQFDSTREIINLAAEGRQVPLTRFGKCGPDWCKKVTLSPRILRVLLGLSKNHTFEISALTDGNHDLPDGKVSEHYRGDAADISKVDGVSTNPTTPRFRGFAEDALRMLPSGGGVGQKYDTRFGHGNKSCIGDIDVPQGRRYFGDGCDHVHIDAGGP